LEASIKIDVYSYRIDHRRASCSAGVLCRGCWAVTCNMQPSIYWKHLGNSPIAVILYSVHIVALDLLCCHCRRSHLHGIRFLQLCQVTKRSLNKADHCMHWEMATKQSNSRGKPSVKFWLLTLIQNQELRLVMLKANFRKTKKKKKSSIKPKQKANYRLQQEVEDYQPGDRLKEGTQILILSLDQQKVCKKVRFLT